MTNVLSIITPTNLESEREKFFASATYHPRFQYQWQYENFNFNSKSAEKNALWDAIKIQNITKITKIASEMFEVTFSDADIAKAHRDAKMNGNISDGDALSYARLMQDAFRYFDITDFSVDITKADGFNSRPDHKNNRLVVSKSIHFEYFSMEGEVRHEMVHILRYRNGKSNHIKNSSRFLPTEEGLASWCQDNTNDDNGLAQHAIEYVASSVGMSGSLRDIYNCMREFGMSPELAWKRSCRHKFGFVDTAFPGDIMKPAMYYINEVKVGKLSTEERVRLFVGKINQEELDLYPNYSGQWPDEKLIEYFHL